MAKIIIKRKNSLAGSAINFDVYLMNDYIGVCKAGSTLEIPVDIGLHTLYFKKKRKINKQIKDFEFTAVVNKEDEVVELKVKAVNNGFVVSYADNAPHVPTATYETSDNSESETNVCEHQIRFACPRCKGHNLTSMSEISTEGRDFNSSNACCGYLLCGPLGLLFGLSGKGKQMKTDTYWLCKDCGHKFKI